MAALRVTVKSGMLQLGSTSAEMDYLMLDSWKAEVFLCAVDLPAVYMNGSPLGEFLMFPGGAANPPAVLKLKFGGLVLGGRIINLNDRLQFSYDGGGGGGTPLAFLLTKTYYDPDLVDPSRR